MSDPLHGVTLQMMLERLVEHLKTPWARLKVENLYRALPGVEA